MCLINNWKYNELVSLAGELPNSQVIAALFAHICSDSDLAFLHFSTCENTTDRQPYVASTYPEKWLSDYYDNDLHHLDPMTTQLFSSGEPISWTDVQADTDAGIFIMEQRLRILGSQAITLPFYSSDGRSSKLSIAAKSDDRNWSKRIIKSFASFKQLGMTLHATVLQSAGTPPPDVWLSKRQVDCLKMLASGMNEQQIGHFFAISEKSVKSYIKEAMIRLNARSKVQAVAYAMGMGILTTQ